MKLRAPTMTMTMTMMLMVMAACAEPAPEPQDTCGVSDAAATQTQGLQRLTPVLDIVLDDDLGGLVCTAPAEANDGCQDLLDESCVGELDAVIGVASEVTVHLRAQQLPLTVASVAVESDCGWLLEDESGFNIDAGTEVPLAITFLGDAAGTCEGRLVIVTGREGDTTGTTITVALRATVNAD